MKFRVLFKTRKSIITSLICSVFLIILGISGNIRFSPMDQLWFGSTLMIWTIFSALTLWLGKKWNWLHSVWMQLVFLAILIYSFIGVLSIIRKGF